MHNMCNICMPQAVCDVISSIAIGAAAADSIGCQASAWYQSNPSSNPNHKPNPNLRNSGPLE